MVCNQRRNSPYGRVGQLPHLPSARSRAAAFGLRRRGCRLDTERLNSNAFFWRGTEDPGAHDGTSEGRRPNTRREPISLENHRPLPSSRSPVVAPPPSCNPPLAAAYHGAAARRRPCCLCGPPAPLAKLACRAAAWCPLLPICLSSSVLQCRASRLWRRTGWYVSSLLRANFR